MSGTSLTVSGGLQPTGIIPVTSKFSTASGINVLLQEYLSGLSGSVTTSGAFTFENNDVAAAQDFSTLTGGALEDITNFDTTGASIAGTGSYDITVPAAATNLVVQAPGNVTVNGNASTSFALFGASSNVDYLQLDGGANSIFTAGGNDSLTFITGLDNGAESVYSAGNDTINLKGQGSDLVSIDGSADDVIQMQDAASTVYASGNATTKLFWDNQFSGGTLDFINNSSNAATIFTAVFGASTAATHVTAFGGAGGGFFVGGQAGANSLTGGSGIVTLVGGGDTDTLTASGFSTTSAGNAFFAGSGNETMIATSSTGANLFQVGLNYPGLGEPTGNGLISTSGAGNQAFFLGNSNGETIYGSTALTAANAYNIVGDSTAGGGNFVINNFNPAKDYLLFINGSDSGTGDASVTSIGADPNFGAGSTQILLSDHTQIHLIGVTPGQLSQNTIPGSGIVYIS